MGIGMKVVWEMEKCVVKELIIIINKILNMLDNFLIICFMDGVHSKKTMLHNHHPFMKVIIFMVTNMDKVDINMVQTIIIMDNGRMIWNMAKAYITGHRVNIMENGNQIKSMDKAHWH